MDVSFLQLTIYSILDMADQNTDDAYTSFDWLILFDTIATFDQQKFRLAVVNNNQKKLRLAVINNQLKAVNCKSSLACADGRSSLVTGNNSLKMTFEMALISNFYLRQDMPEMYNLVPCFKQDLT